MTEMTIYERIARGEPLMSAVPTRIEVPERRPLIQVVSDFWTLGEWPLGIPKVKARPAPDIQRMTRDLRRWTNWSARRTGAILGTSHTTILAIEDGRPLAAGHSGDLRRRLDEAHSVVSRVFVLAGENPMRTAEVLGSQPLGELSSSAADALMARDPSRAYLYALDVLTPAAEGMLVGTRPSTPGKATAPLHE